MICILGFLNLRKTKTMRHLKIWPLQFLIKTNTTLGYPVILESKPKIYNKTNMLLQTQTPIKIIFSNM